MEEFHIMLSSKCIALLQDKQLSGLMCIFLTYMEHVLTIRNQKKRRNSER